MTRDECMARFRGAEDSREGWTCAVAVAGSRVSVGLPLPPVRALDTRIVKTHRTPAETAVPYARRYVCRLCGFKTHANKKEVGTFLTFAPASATIHSFVRQGTSITQERSVRHVSRTILIRIRRCI